MLTGDCRIKTGISAGTELWPGHDDDDDDDDDDMGGLTAVAAAVAAQGPTLDWLSHADVTADVDAAATDSVGCDSCLNSWWGCDAGILWAPKHTQTTLKCQIFSRS